MYLDQVLRDTFGHVGHQVMPPDDDPAFNYPPGGRRAHLEKMLQDKTQAFKADKGAKP